MTVLDTFRLNGRVIVLTGGAGLYGRQLAAAISEAGAELITAARDVAALEAAAEPLRAQGGRVSCEHLDQGDEQSVLSLHEKVMEKHGHIDGLVNNAVARTMRSLDDATSTWEESMRVNATGVFLMTRAFGETMCRSGSGSIVNIGSIQGNVGPDPQLYAGTNMGLPPPDYFFHKGGMMNLTRYFASVYGSQGVRVNCISPGGFFNHQPEPFLTRYCEHTMLGRMAGDNDLGPAVVFLLSNAAGYITGIDLPVDGGYTAK